MFGKKSYTIEPISANEDVLIQISEPAEITKKTKISVPTQHKATQQKEYKINTTRQIFMKNIPQNISAVFISHKLRPC